MVLVDLLQSVKVREGYVKGDVKVTDMPNWAMILPQSVKVREGSVKGKQKALILPQSVKVREGSVKISVKGY